MNRFQKLAIATAGATILLFAVGGLVRGTGSGLGCTAWPACEPGRVFPSGTIHSLIEFSHRVLVFVVTALAILTAGTAWRTHRHVPSLVWPAVAAIPLVIVQAVLGGIVVNTDLDPWWVTAHFATALLLVADVTFVAAVAVDREPARRPPAPDDARFARLVLATTMGCAALLLVGTYVRARGAGLAFTDWPMMDGRLVPTLGGIATPMFLHRLLAALVFLLVLWTAVRARVVRPRSGRVVALSGLALGLFAAQILSGAANVWTRLRPWAVVVHVAGSVLIWAALVTLATVSARMARHAEVAVGDDPDSESGGTIRQTVTAYVRLTKPRIVVLLLITTVPAMILAAGGMPPVWLILATLVGGAVAAGSANAINMYLDRDIDQVMRRTRRRPIPSHAIAPEQALRFGFVLGAGSFYFLAIVVNVLAATIAVSAIAFYVFVYTMWLKRTTAQNIVIGGAAGAAPALVGWAAVTGTLAAPAWVLFAIVFLWTPPHFWALSMRFSGDYAAAGVPMLPVVRGPDETRRQIVLYSLVLVAATLVLVPVGHMGPIYLAGAIALGGIFLYRAGQLRRRPEDGGQPWALFKYSIVYLAALFGAVAVDALVRR
jgi:protoheme IX farnesyltransferase